MTIAQNNFASRSRAANDAAVSAWYQSRAEAIEAAQAAAFRAPLSNKERCGARHTQRSWVLEISGGYQEDVSIAFFDRRGALLREEHSVDRTWAGGAPAPVIRQKPGDAFARIESVWAVNGGTETYVRLVALSY